MLTAMTTIHTMEDLMQVLDEHPQWIDAMRARLLTRELLEMPQRLAEFATSTQQRFEEMDKRLADLATSTQQRFEEVGRRIDERLASIETSLAMLNGAHAANVAAKQASLIADDLGLTLTRILTSDDLVALVRSQDLSDVPKNELESFRRADLILETSDAAGARCYVPVEASYTVNGRDTRRAIRNAELLTRLTGEPARPVVAGARIDDRVRDGVDAGEVYWYEIDERSMHAA